ncbi:MAG: hypothetical protein LBV72_00555 [Tannerella sp.]|jgi:hypothetical protein|nr:hypothetical protein [Tannerella sp.]
MAKYALKVIQFFIMKMLGYKYVVNNKSREIHLLKYKHTNFDIYSIADYSFVKNDCDLDFYYRDFNGCRFCLPELDTDKNNFVEIDE